tara:strand:+ start:65 stop:490 length:426 start_codon:yes stop_codon:yes gene_type:complete
MSRAQQNANAIQTSLADLAENLDRLTHKQVVELAVIAEKLGNLADNFTKPEVETDWFVKLTQQLTNKVESVVNITCGISGQVMLETLNIDEAQAYIQQHEGAVMSVSAEGLCDQTGLSQVFWTTTFEKRLSDLPVKYLASL